MLYLRSLTLNRFKSFRHAELLFSKGFNCIVGPNGSGKSNICDALLFALGESSLKRLRIDRLEQLLSNSSLKQNRQGAVRKAYVKVIFGGDESLEVIRVARADGKSVFRVNGKRMTRQDAVETLRRYKLNADETNTITQGEINRMMDLNPKERRELIDIAAGIKEFEDKKGESLRELDRVNMRMSEARVTLSERLGVLRELEKDKIAAESYMSLNSRLRSLKYSILVTKEKEIRETYDAHSRDLAILDSREQKLISEIDELHSETSKLTADRQQVARELDESTISASGDTRKLESINKEIAVTDTELENNGKLLNEKGSEVRRLNEELSRIRKSIETNDVELGSVQKRVHEIEPVLSQESAEYDTGASEGRLASLNERIGRLESELSTAQNDVFALQADLSMTKSAVIDLNSRLGPLSERVLGKQRIKKELSENIVRLSNEAKELEARIAQNESDAGRLNPELGSMDESLIELREQMTIARGRENSSLERIRGRFTEADGFYGKVSQLCSYSADHASAVEASAGGRFDYLVVDSIETASRIIEHLKKNDLGRATFIPIAELSFESERRKEPELSAVIDLIGFDKRFERVFEYVFNNTYMIGNVLDAKRFGVSKHRYVTLSGELVEQSGIVSGGSARRGLSLASLESRFREVSDRKKECLAELDGLNKRVFQNRKEKAARDLELAAANSQTSNLNNEISELESEASRVESALRSQSSKIQELELEIEVRNKRREIVSNELIAAKNESTGLYNGLIETAKSMVKRGANKEEKERLGKARAEFEKLKIKSAELQTQNQMFESRRAEVEKQESAMAKAAQSLKEGIKEEEAKRVVLEKGRSELENKIRNSSEHSSRAYERLSEIDARIGKLGLEKGRRSTQKEEAERQLNDLRLKRSQLEVRLVDIRAELGAYPSGVEVVSSSVEEMERESGAISMRINELGNVNLKAPEMYEIKKRNVDEANGRLDTLVNERDAVLRMIEEIDSKKLRIFTETFEAVNRNFVKLYSYVLPEKAQIELENQADPFNSGLHIVISDGRVSKRENSLSGGEKSLVMLMLIFAIHMHKPSSLYIFDEVDTTLDKENSKKLSQLIKELSKSSQFIVVSHNDSLILNTDTAIGVARSEEGSKAVGLQIANLVSEQQQSRGA